MFKKVVISDDLISYLEARNLQKQYQNRGKAKLISHSRKRVVISSSVAGMSGSYDNPVVPLWREVRDSLKYAGGKPLKIDEIRSGFRIPASELY